MFKEITNETLVNNGVNLVALILILLLTIWVFGIFILLGKKFIHKNLLILFQPSCWDYLDSNGIIHMYGWFCDNVRKSSMPI